MMLALVATAAASQHSTIINNGYDEQSELHNQCYWISVQQCLKLHGVTNVSVEDLRAVVRRNEGEVNECNSRGCDEYEPDHHTHSILQDQYGVRIQVARADNLTNPAVNNPWEDYSEFSPRVMHTPDAPVCRIVHKPGHFELYADSSVTLAVREQGLTWKISPVHTPTSSPASSRSTARASLPPTWATTDARGIMDDFELKCQLHFANIKPLSSKKLDLMYVLAERAQVRLMGQLRLARVASLPDDVLESLDDALVRVAQILSTVEHIMRSLV